jgi:hypothetical protein
MKLRQYIYPRFADRRLEHKFILDNNEKAARQARWQYSSTRPLIFMCGMAMGW